MKMTMKVTFDPTEVSPKDLKDAVEKVDNTLDVQFHSARETAAPKPAKPAPKPEAVRS